MALNVNYIARETGLNLKRNLTLTIASLLTVVVSLTLVGIAFLVRQGVANASGKFRGNIELIVFLEPKIEPAQREAIGKSLEENPEVKKATYVNQKQAFEEFKELFKDSPETVQSVTADILPSSYRVVPENPDYQATRALKQSYERKAGVREVVSADETIKALQQITGKINIGVALAGVALLVTALLLIFNTIRTAMFARRREIEVMKLVGATNWFIRIPFMLEGLIQGVLGGGIAVGLLFGFNRLMTTQLGNRSEIQFFQNFVVESGDVWSSGLLLLAVGAIVGTLGSGLAVTRFLDV